MGVPVPKVLINLLEIMRQKGDGPEEQQKNTDSDKKE